MDVHGEQCDMPHVLPMILFMIWARRGKEAKKGLSVRIDSFADWWGLLQTADSEGYPYLIRSFLFWTHHFSKLPASL